MSGGAFDYKQYHLNDIADEIDAIVRRNGTEDACGNVQRYSRKTLMRMRSTAEHLRRAAKMVQRIDWLVSGDDGEETFHKRWKEEIGITR